MDRLIELAKQCEQATGPDLVLDKYITHELYPHDRDMQRCCESGSFRPSKSLDAAMKAIPRDAQADGIVREAVSGLAKRFRLHISFWPATENYAEWLARFITAAALRARSQSTPDILRSDD